MIIVSRIIHVKVDRRLNVTNKFKYQRRLSTPGRRIESIQRKGWKVCRGKDGKYTEERMESIQRKGW